MLKVKLTGDWSKARSILSDRSELRSAISFAVLQEAQLARRDIVKGITEQSPGGKPFEPLKELTLVFRKLRRFKGTKALLVSGALRGSITVQQVGPGRAFVGVLRSARGKGGKDLINVARVHELGEVIVVRVTPKMRRYLMAMLRQTRLGKKKGERGKFAPSGTGQLKRGIIVIKVPARPFISPVIEKLQASKRDVQTRLAARIAKKLRLRMGSA